MIQPQDTGPLADVAAVIERSDERDLYVQRILAAWCEGYAAGERARAGDYERGFYDGVMASKRRDHLMVEMIRLQVARYGPDSRQVTDPKPEDFPGMMLRGQDGAA